MLQCAFVRPLCNVLADGFWQAAEDVFGPLFRRLEGLETFGFGGIIGIRLKLPVVVGGAPVDERFEAPGDGFREGHRVEPRRLENGGEVVGELVEGWFRLGGHLMSPDSRSFDSAFSAEQRATARRYSADFRTTEIGLMLR